MSHISRYNERGMGHLLIILLAMATICGQTVRARELSIAAASDLVFCLENSMGLQIKRIRDRLEIDYRRPGICSADQQWGAIDVFLSADMRYPLELISWLGVARISHPPPSDTSSSGPQVTLWISGIQSLAAPRIRR